MPVPSPCTGECRLDAQQLCTGCRRHAQEIAEWSSASPERRLQIRELAGQRGGGTASRLCGPAAPVPGST